MDTTRRLVPVVDVILISTPSHTSTRTNPKPSRYPHQPCCFRLAGLESIYSPMELPVPSAFTRETSREHMALDGVRLSPDGYQAFMAIMNSWRVFGGRCVLQPQAGGAGGGSF
jgi:hypothetical protein